MRSEWKMLTKAAMSLLLVGLIAGAMLTSVFAADEAKSQPASPPPSPRTAYVDFFKLLKEDSKLKREQARLSADLQSMLYDLRTEYEPRRRKLIEVQDKTKPQAPDFVTAKHELEKVELEYTQKAAQLEFDARLESGQKAIKAFTELRELVTTIAKERGYTQVLNVVLDLEKVADQHDDFRQLQQQLLLSPVLFHDAAHDLTALVQAEADKTRKLNVELTFDGACMVQADGKDGADLKALAENAEKVDFEVKLGQTIRFKTSVKVNGKVPEGENARVECRRATFAGGSTQDDKYTAPAEFTKDGMVLLRLTCIADHNVTREIRIRLLDKNGKPVQPKAEGEKRPEGTEGEKKPG